MQAPLFRILAVAALALVLVAAGPVLARPEVLSLTPAQGIAPADADRLHRIPTGGELRLESLRLEGPGSLPVSMDLKRVEVFSPDARIVVVGEHGTEELPPPQHSHFVGTVDGNPDDLAFWTMDEDGNLRGVVHRGNAIFVSEITPDTLARQGTTASRRIEPRIDFAGRGFQCGVTGGFTQPPSLGVPGAGPLQELQQSARQAAHALSAESLDAGAEDLEPSSSDPLASEPAVGETITPRVAELIIETDYEYFYRFGSQAAAAGYIADLFGYVGQLYQNQIQTRLSLKTIYIYTTAADPWTAANTGSALTELRNYWNTSPRNQVSRNHVHLVSGKSMGGGIAYLDTLCSAYQGWAYAVSASISGNFSPGNPQVVWDSLVVAHEIGHSFGSTHTHNYGPSASDPVDCCYAEAAGQCQTLNGGNGSTSMLPGTNSLTGGNSGQGVGTIMSYCHLSSQGGGYGNISMTFGDGHTRGVDAFRVPDLMRARAAACLPQDDSGGSGGDTHTLSVTVSGSGTVSSSPAGIQCTSGTCSTPFTVDSTVNLTATPATGWSFSGWSGACTGTGSCSVTMSQARSVTATFVQNVVQLTNGGSTTSLSGPQGSEQHFSIAVPSGATNLVIAISGGFGDADLYVRHGAQPTLSEYQCRPYLTGNNEQCSFPSPGPGTWHIMLHGWSGYSGVTLTASYQTPQCSTTVEISGTVSDTREYISCGTMATAPSGFDIQPTGNVRLRAGERIALKPGFRIRAGGRFKATIDLSLTPPAFAGHHAVASNTLQAFTGDRHEHYE